MAYFIRKEDCVNCAACEPECPVDCITEQGDVRFIDPDACTSCGACAEVCPTDCIEAD